jgi:hypothetical protein
VSNTRRLQPIDDLDGLLRSRNFPLNLGCCGMKSSGIPATATREAERGIPATMIGGSPRRREKGVPAWIVPPLNGTVSMDTELYKRSSPSANETRAPPLVPPTFVFGVDTESCNSASPLPCSPGHRGCRPPGDRYRSWPPGTKSIASVADSGKSAAPDQMIGLDEDLAGQGASDGCFKSTKIGSCTREIYSHSSMRIEN